MNEKFKEINVLKVLLKDDFIEVSSTGSCVVPTAHLWYGPILHVIGIKSKPGIFISTQSSSAH